MTYVYIAAYLYVGLCMWAATPPHLPWYWQIVTFLNWPGIMLTAIFWRLIKGD